VEKLVRSTAMELRRVSEQPDTAAGKADPGIVSLAETTNDKLEILEAQASTHSRRIRSLAVEAHKKVAISFACLVFVLIGVPIGVRTREGGAGSGMVFSILFFSIYYAFLSAGEKLADRGYVQPALSMWAANIVLGITGCWMFYRANRELPFVPCFILDLLKARAK
jgi:lipopolysaccharide export system permease protein